MCGDVGTPLSSTTIAFDLSDISTVTASRTFTKTCTFDFTDEDNGMPATEEILASASTLPLTIADVAQNCSALPGYFWDEDNPWNISFEPDDPCHPIIHVPEKIKALQEEWKYCTVQFDGFYDPPKTLGLQEVLVPTVTGEPRVGSLDNVATRTSSGSGPRRTMPAKASPPDTAPSWSRGDVDLPSITVLEQGNPQQPTITAVILTTLTLSSTAQTITLGGTTSILPNGEITILPGTPIIFDPANPQSPQDPKQPSQPPPQGTQPLPVTLHPNDAPLLIDGTTFSLTTNSLGSTVLLAMTPQTQPQQQQQQPTTTTLAFSDLPSLFSSLSTTLRIGGDAVTMNGTTVSLTTDDAGRSVIIGVWGSAATSTSSTEPAKGTGFANSGGGGASKSVTVGASSTAFGNAAVKRFVGVERLCVVCMCIALGCGFGMVG